MIRSALTAFCLLIAAVAQAQPPPAPCRSVSFEAELSAGDSFGKMVGGNLVFRLHPMPSGPKGRLNGWRLILAPSQAEDKDYIYPVNPPLRFNGLQILGPSYDEDTKASLGQPHEMRFLLNQADYDRISPLVTNALWPYSAPRPDLAADEYVTALKTINTGWLKLTVLSYKPDSATGELTDMKFGVQIKVPRDFVLAPGLKPEPTACPSNPTGSGWRLFVPPKGPRVRACFRIASLLGYGGEKPAKGLQRIFCGYSGFSLEGTEIPLESMIGLSSGTAADETALGVVEFERQPPLVRRGRWRSGFLPLSGRGSAW